MNESKHILIAPLNWGLGHATRCIPIIDAFLEQGVKVTIASDGAALDLLRAEYPQLPYLELPSYNITYKTGNMFLNIAPQIPKILSAIRLERQYLNSIISTYKFDTIISDNRYGLYNNRVHCVLMTHQLNILIPNKLVQSWIANLNRKYISRFSECWVPDFAQEPSLAGDLSHGKDWKNVVYIGPLSRMKYEELESIYDVIAVLSGPEPQRSIFEQKIIQQALLLPQKKFLIVSGKTGKQEQIQLAPHIIQQNYMTTTELNKAMLQSRFVIARSGYSTIMDLVQLRCKNVLLVPTPGQTEQEYLAKRYHENKQFQYQEQKNLNIHELIC